MSNDRPPVDFFLDEGSSPMSLCVVYDTDGPDELEVALGRFRAKSDAMAAVTRVTELLQDAGQRWRSVPRALLAVQPLALQLTGNLGLQGHTTTVDQPSSAGSAGSADGGLAQNLLSSARFQAQRGRVQRVTLSDQQIGELLNRLIAAPGHRLDQTTAAKALGVPSYQMSGALPMVQRLLNIDQYPVLERDPDGTTIVLDVEMLKEQFGVDA